MNLQRMKNKIAHALAGLTIGFVCYALFLFAFVLFGMPRHQTTYMLMPLSDSISYSSIAMQLQLLWTTHRAELIAVLFGLPIPLAFSLLAWYLAGKRPIAWLHHWYVQLVFAGVGLAALLFTINIISFML